MRLIKMHFGPGVGRHPDRAQSLDARPSAPAQVPAGDTFPELLAALADVHEHAPFGYFIGLDGVVERVSWREMIDRAERFAAGLAELGVGPADRVVLALPNSADLLACFLACQIRGALPCIVDPPRAGPGLRPSIERLKPKLDVVRPEAIVAEDQQAEALAALLSSTGAPRVVGVAALPRDRRLPWHAARGTDPAFLQFTSGTTSAQKAVSLSHRALCTNVRCLGAQGQWRRDDLMVGWLPLFHDMGLVATALAAVSHGIPIALMSPFCFLLRPARWLWTIHAMRGSLSFAPNFAYQLLVRRLGDAEIEGLDLGSWRMACNAAELVHADTIRDFVRRFAPYGFSAGAITPGYGMAEMVVGVSTQPPGQSLIVDCISRVELSRSGRARPIPAGCEDALEVVQVGKVFDQHEVRIVGSTGETLGEREQGEIQLRGPSLFSGYFADERATRRAIPDGWLRTGDLGYLAGGKLFVSGRAKEVIVRGGEKVHPHLIERAAGAVAGVRDGCVAAVGVPNATTGTEDVVIVFETRETCAAKLTEIGREIERAVRHATVLAPDRLVPVAPGSIPKTSSGKVRRGVIRQRLAHLLQHGVPLERDLLLRGADAEQPARSAAHHAQAR